jgi:truncated hemoglobin YjbI
VTVTEQSLYERLGGVNAIAMVVDRFSDKIVENPKLNVNPQLREWKGLVARPEVYSDAVALCRGWGAVPIHRQGAARAS